MCVTCGPGSLVGSSVPRLFPVDSPKKVLFPLVRSGMGPLLEEILKRFFFSPLPFSEFSSARSPRSQGGSWDRKAPLSAFSFFLGQPTTWGRGGDGSPYGDCGTGLSLMGASLAMHVGSSRFSLRGAEVGCRSRQ